MFLGEVVTAPCSVTTSYLVVTEVLKKLQNVSAAGWRGSGLAAPAPYLKVTLEA